MKENKKISIPLPTKYISILDQHIDLINNSIPNGKVYSTRTHWCREAFQEKIERELNLIKEQNVENKSLIDDIEEMNSKLR
jgi:hypothetical protein